MRKAKSKATAATKIQIGARGGVGRSCGDCSLCCTLLPVKEIEKPEYTPCQHCPTGRGGCAIYETRPETCRGFSCEWLVNPTVGDEWYPLRSGMVLASFFRNDGDGLHVVVDPDRSDVWEQQPFLHQIEELSKSIPVTVITADDAWEIGEEAA